MKYDLIIAIDPDTEKSGVALLVVLGILRWRKVI